MLEPSADVRATARGLIDRYGDEAIAFAAGCWRDRAINNDAHGAEVWRQIIEVIERKLATVH